EPRAAGGDLARAGLGVDAALAARLPLEVLHDVRDIDPPAIDPRIRERAIEKLACGADERATREVFLVARLLADEHQGGVAIALAEHRLGAPLPQRARATVRRRSAQRDERGPWR